MVEQHSAQFAGSMSGEVIHYKRSVIG
jgi:hypothetical protein